MSRDGPRNLGKTYALPSAGYGTGLFLYKKLFEQNGVIIMIPSVMVFILFQRSIMEGATLGAVKG